MCVHIGHIHISVLANFSVYRTINPEQSDCYHFIYLGQQPATFTIVALTLFRAYIQYRDLYMLEEKMATPDDKVNHVGTLIQTYDYIRFTWADLNGINRGKTIPARNAHKFLKSGTGIYSGALTIGPRGEVWCTKELEEAKYPNATMMPDLETLHALPWSGDGTYKVGELYCEPQWLDSGDFQAAGPRFVARQMVQKLDQLNLKIMSAFELEFLLRDMKTQTPVFDTPDYCCNVVMSDFDDFFYDADKKFVQAGLNLEAFHTEHGPGQFEAVTEPVWGIQSADDAFLFKHGLKEMAKKKGYDANFTAKPNPVEAGSGTHFNFSLWYKDSEKNALGDASGPDGLSELAQYFIGGFAKHMAAIATLCAPTVNCYRRFHQPWAPDVTDWNIDDRTCSLRIKNWNAKNVYMENRLPSGLCNPYLVLAATIAAGIDGIVNKIKCPPKGAEGTVPLPYTLEEALDALEKDTVMVESLGPEFVEWFVGSKKNVDLEKLKSNVKENNEKDIKEECDWYGKLI